MNIAIFQILIACGDSTAQSNLDTIPQKSPETTAPAAPEKKSTPTKETPEVKHAANTSGMPDLLKGLATDGCDNGPGIFRCRGLFLQ